MASGRIEGFDYNQFERGEIERSMGRTLDASSQLAQMQSMMMTNQYVSRLQEHVYNDVYLGGGKYNLERSAWRDFAYGSGLAQSNFGRAFKIGGRKPEWITQHEFQRQIALSSEMRWDEFKEGLIENTLRFAPMAFGPVGMAVGVVADPFIDMMYADNRAGRDAVMFANANTANRGIGQRTFSRKEADDLGRYFHSRDRSWASHLPLIGSRFNPDTDLEQVWKAEFTGGGLKNLNLRDTDGVKRHVEDMRKLLEDGAATMNTTKEAMQGFFDVLSKFNITTKRGREQMSGVLREFRAANGLSFEQAQNEMTNYMLAADASGQDFTAASRHTMQQRTYANLLKEQGIISAGADPASLALQSQEGAANWARYTGAGMVASAGGGLGNVSAWAAMAAQRGGGNIAEGYMRLKLGMEHGNITPHQAQIKHIRDMINGYGNAAGYAAMEQMGYTGDSAKMMWNEAAYGIDINATSALLARSAKARNDNNGKGDSEIFDDKDMDVIAKGKGLGSTGKQLIAINSLQDAMRSFISKDNAYMLDPIDSAAVLSNKASNQIMWAGIGGDGRFVRFDKLQAKANNLLADIVTDGLTYDQAKEKLVHYIKSFRDMNIKDADVMADRLLVSSGLSSYTKEELEKKKKSLLPQGYSINMSLLDKVSGIQIDDDIFNRLKNKSLTLSDAKTLQELYKGAGIKNKGLDHLLGLNFDRFNEKDRKIGLWGQRSELNELLSADIETAGSLLSTVKYKNDMGGQLLYEEAMAKLDTIAKNAKVKNTDEFKSNVLTLSHLRQRASLASVNEDPMKRELDLTDAERNAMKSLIKSGTVTFNDQFLKQMESGRIGGNKIGEFISATSTISSLDSASLSAPSGPSTDNIRYLADAVWALSGKKPTEPPKAKTSDQSGAASTTYAAPTPHVGYAASR